MDERQPLISSERSYLYQGSRRREDRETWCNTLISELKWHNLLLRHSREDLFYSCQWDWSPCVFVLYRLAVAAYSFSVLILNIMYYDREKWKHFPWPVWLTHWSFFILTAHFMLAALITVLYSCERGRCFQQWSLRSSVYSFLPDADLETLSSSIPATQVPWYIRLDWLLYNVSSVAAIIVTVVFFSTLYRLLNPNGGLDWKDGTMHLSNSILVLVDVSLCAIPVRLLHGFYCLIYGLLYMIFSIIYWALDHNNVIYPRVLDWNNPLATSVVTLLLLIVAVPVLQVAFFGLYRFRIRVYKLIYMQD